MKRSLHIPCITIFFHKEKIIKENRSQTAKQLHFCIDPILYKKSIMIIKKA